jgi:GT2 family glycosyltransferase
MADNDNSVLILVPTLGKRLGWLDLCLKSLDNQTFRPDVCVAYPCNARSTMKSLQQKYSSFDFIEVEGSQSAVINHVFINLSHHKYVNWIGDDDLLYPNSIDEGLKTFEKFPESVGVFGKCQYIDEEGRDGAKLRTPKIANILSSYIPGLLKLEGGLFKRELFVKSGGIDTNLKYSPDADVILKLRNFGYFTRSNHYLAKFRIHSLSITSQNRSRGLIEGLFLQLKFANRKFDKIVVCFFFIPVFVLKHLVFFLLSLKISLVGRFGLN